MRLNNIPMQSHPDTLGRGPRGKPTRGEAEQRRRAEEAGALTAMAQQPVFLLNGREPDCLSAQCRVPTFRQLERARGGLGAEGYSSRGMGNSSSM